MSGLTLVDVARVSGPRVLAASRCHAGSVERRVALLLALAMQANRLSDLVKLFPRDFLELFALCRELFINADRLFRHDFVSFFRAAQQDKIRPGCHPFVAVVIKTQAEHQGGASLLFLAHIRHWPKGKV